MRFLFNFTPDPKILLKLRFLSISDNVSLGTANLTNLRGKWTISEKIFVQVYSLCDFLTTNSEVYWANNNQCDHIFQSE